MFDDILRLRRQRIGVILLWKYGLNNICPLNFPKILQLLMKYLLISIALILLTQIANGWTFKPVEIGTNGSPRGYWEFLPAAYETNPDKQFPVILFFHGKGEKGDGLLAADGESISEKLQRVLGNSIPNFHNNNSNVGNAAVNDLFESEEVITLSPQTNLNAWSQSQIRDFLDYALQHYRIDPKRIYFTGLSNGSFGIHVFVNTDPNARDVTAIIASANRGKIETEAGLAAAEGIPYWALTGQHDTPNGYESANNIAGALLGTGPTNLGQGNANDPRYPRDGSTHTALFDRVTGTWEWQVGVVKTTDVSPKLTIYPNAGHSTWNRTYKNLDCWDWLFKQVKPTITLTHPSTAALLIEGESINLQATAIDKDEQNISESNITWFSNIDGELGSGTNITVDNLGIGVHEITCQALDNGYRVEVATAPIVTVVASGSYRIFADFGDKNIILAPGNWNHITHESTGLVENAIDDQGNFTGVRIEIETPFTARNTGGTTEAGLYPVEAKQDNAFTTAKSDAPSIVKVSGLNPNRTFKFTFFGSRNASGNRLTFYRINDEFVSLETAENDSNVVMLDGISPNLSGEVRIEVYASEQSTYAYLSLFEMETIVENTNTYEDWISFYNLEGDDALPDSDPDNDRISNFVERAFGRQPNTPDQMRLISEYIQLDAGSPFLNIRFNRNPNINDVRFVVKSSTDLIQWTEIGRHDQGINSGDGFVSENDDGPTKRMEFRHMIETDDNIFIRVDLESIDS